MNIEEVVRWCLSDFLPDWVSTDKVRYSLTKLELMGIIKREGIGKGTKYKVIKWPDNLEL